MGAVTARAAGVREVAVCAPPGEDGDLHPVILAACALCGVDEVYRMGGAQAVAALALGTEAVPAVDVLVGPGNLYVQEAKRQLSHRVGIDGFAGPSELLVVLAGDGARPARPATLDLLAQAEHGPESLVAAVATDPDVLRALAEDLEALAPSRPTAVASAAVLVQAPRLDAALAFAQALAPEHVQLVGADAEALRRAVTPRRGVYVGRAAGTAFGDYVAGSNHVLPTGGAARFASPLGPRDVPPPHQRGAPRRRGAGAGRGRRGRGPGRGLRRPRPVDGGARAGECDAVTRSAEITRTTKETELSLRVGARRHRRGRARHRDRLLRPHARPAGPPRAPRPRGQGRRRPRDRRPPHGRGHRARASARRWTRRSATVPGSPATATRSCPWTRRARPAPWTSPGGRCWCGRPTCRPGRSPTSTTSWPRSSSARSRQRAKLTLHLSVDTGTNAHHMVEAAFKAFARALRVAMAIDPTETGVPETKGTLTE